MNVAYISHSDCGRHDTGWRHPEHVGRLRAIPRALREDVELYHALEQLEGRHATEDELALAHHSGYIEEVRYVAFMPARVTFEGKRAQKARTTTELHENGFHGVRVDCRDCGKIAERAGDCPVCEAAGPIRARPG